MRKFFSVVAVFVVVLTSGCAVIIAPLDSVVTHHPQSTHISGGLVTSSPAKCIVGGKNFGDISEAACQEVLRKNTVTSDSSVSGTKPFSVSSSPTVVNGHSCAVLDKSGSVLADFLDASKNPKKTVVSSGEECVQAKKAFLSTRQ